MKVKFLKDHLDNKKGDTVEVDPDRANYWEMTGVAEKVKKEGDSEKKEANPVTAKKQIHPTKKGK